MKNSYINLLFTEAFNINQITLSISILSEENVFFHKLYDER